MTVESSVPLEQEKLGNGVENPEKEQHHQGSVDTAVPKWRLPFYSHPIQRQRWGDTQAHPVVNWGDLFFDLFYVAAAYNLSNIIRNSPSAEGLLYFCGCFWPIMHQWWSKMYYDSRFHTHDDLFHRVFEICVILTVATAVLHVRAVDVLSNPQEHADMFALCLALLLGTTLTAFRYLEILVFGCNGQPVARVAARRDLMSNMIPWCLQAAAMSVAAYDHFGTRKDDDKGDHRFLAEGTATDGHDYGEVTSTTNMPIWLLVGSALGWMAWFTFIIFSLPKNGKHKEITVPMNIDFSIHRYGEWTMLMLGESILSLLIVEISDNLDYYITFYAGILSVILLQYMHFRSQPHHADEHAMRRSKEAGYAFSCLMQVYSAALIILGVDYKMLLYEYTYESDSRRMLMDFPRWLAGDASLPFTDDERQQRIANFFCGSLAIVFFCSDAMILAHKGLKDNMGRCRCKHSGNTKLVGIVLVLLRIGLIAFVATLSRYETDPEQLSLIGLASICAQLVLRVVSSSVFPDDRVHIETDSHGRESTEDPEEDKWPNVTHARAQESSFADGPSSTI